MAKTLGVKRTANLKAVEALGLPTPRLQFRWEEKDSGDGFNWFCHYELVLSLDTNDIRNPHEYIKPGELTLSLGGTKAGVSSGRTPISRHDGQVDTPFRDGAHAVWDGAQLGNPPVFAICGNTVTDVKRVKEARQAVASSQA